MFRAGESEPPPLPGEVTVTGTRIDSADISYPFNLELDANISELLPLDPRPEARAPAGATVGCPPGTSADPTKSNPDYTGDATMYGENLDGSPDQFADQVTSSGEKMDPDAMTAASVRNRDSKGRLLRSTLIPLRSTVLVVLASDPNKSIYVRINDSGPLRPGRILDLTPRAMRTLTGKAYNTVAVKVYRCK